MANIKQINLGTSQSPNIFDVEALHFNAGTSLDTPAQWKTYIDNLVGKGLQIVIDTKHASKEEPATTASAATMGKLFMVALTGQKSGSYTEFVTVDKGSSASPQYVWEKIGTTDADLTDYAKKTIAGKAGSYTVTATSLTTDNGGAQTAGVDITGIKYQKSAEATGSAGAHTHSVTASGDFTPAGSITGTQSIGAHSHTVNASKSTTTVVTAGTTATDSTGSTTTANSGTAGGHTVNGSNFTFTGTAATLTADVQGASIDDHTYTPEGTISKVTAEAHSHTVNPTAGTVSIGTQTAATKKGIKVATEAADTASVGISGGEASGTANFNTDAIKDVTLAASTVSADGPTYVESISYTKQALSGNTGLVTGYPNFNGGSASGTFVTGVKTDASVTGTKNVGFASTVNNVMSAPTVSAAGVLSWTTTNAATSDEHTMTQMAFNTGNVSWTAASLGTPSKQDVTISDGAVTPTTKYMKRTLTNAGKTLAVTGVTKAALTGTTTFVTSAIKSAALTTDTATAPTFAFNTDAIKSVTLTGDTTFVKSLTIGKAGAINVTPTFTGTAATIAHTYTEGAQGSISIDYTPEGTIGGSQTVAAHSHTYVSLPAHTHGIAKATTTSITYVTGATLDPAGSATVDFTKATFAGTKATVSVSGTAASAGAHTHSITLADATVTGSASAAISNHTHTIGSHTHNVTIPNCA